MEAKFRTLLHTSQEERKPHISEKNLDKSEQEMSPEARELQQKENETRAKKLKKVDHHHIKSIGKISFKQFMTEMKISSRPCLKAKV